MGVVFEALDEARGARGVRRSAGWTATRSIDWRRSSEVLVERARGERWAEREGRYETGSAARNPP